MQIHPSCCLHDIYDRVFIWSYTSSLRFQTTEQEIIFKTHLISLVCVFSLLYLWHDWCIHYVSKYPIRGNLIYFIIPIAHDVVGNIVELSNLSGPCFNKLYINSTLKCTTVRIIEGVRQLKVMWQFLYQLLTMFEFIIVNWTTAHESLFDKNKWLST